MKCEFAPTPLLAALHQDFDHTSNPSLQQCLLINEIPCSNVEETMKSIRFDSPQDLQFSSASVLSFLYTCKTQCTKNATDTSKLNSSLDYISKLATVDRFIQFLFEYWRRQSSESENARCMLSDSEFVTTISNVMQGLTGLACSLVEAYPRQALPDHDENSSFAEAMADSFDAHVLIHFICYTLIRLNHFTRSRPLFLSPLWKGICTIVDNLQFIPQQVATLGMDALLEYIKEGLIASVFDPCEVLLRQDEQAMPLNVDNTLQNNWRILLFLLTRIASFLSRGALCNSTTAIVSALLSIVGAPHAIGSLLRRQSTDMITFLKPLQKLSGKAENMLSAFVTDKNASTGEERTYVFSRVRLELLLQAKAPSWPVASAHASLLQNSFIVGKANLLVNVLRGFPKLEMAEALSDGDVNSLLRISQELVFKILPLCHEVIYFASSSETCADLPNVVVAAVSETLLRCEILAPCLARGADPGLARFHQFLVSFLLPTSNNPIHPLAQEAATDILKLHVLSLAQVNASAYSSFVALLVKLLFSGRVCTALRSNVASLLVLILDDSNQRLKDETSLLIFDETAQLEATLRKPRRSKKRKRTCNTSVPRANDLNLICRVVSACDGQLDLKGDLPSPHKLHGKRNLSCACLQAATAVAAFRSSGMHQQRNTDLMDSVSDLWKARSPLGICPRLVTLAEMVFAYARSSHRSFQTPELICLCTFLGRVCEDSARINDARYMPLFVDAIHTLADISQYICTKASLETLALYADIYHKLLSSTQGVVRSEALSAVIVFISAIPAAEKAQIVPLTVPTESRLLLKSRMESKPANESKLVTSQHVEYVTKLQQISCQYQFNENVLSAVNSFSIKIGSYVVSQAMPTGSEGNGERIALAFFPPGHESLEDVKYIYNGDDADVLTIQKFQVLGDGTLKVYLNE
ncbi:hypothetical protein MPSEU_000454200 [Mayamaea pseudoterrestris]|nr:hypothetical protein MPSEU_000454200 [Mayamaea pseudoterrestris]